MGAFVGVLERCVQSFWLSVLILISFIDLEEFPDAWTLAGTYEHALEERNHGDDESDSEDSEGEAEAGDEKLDDATQDIEEESAKTGGTTNLTAYSEFLQFLQLGCAGSPAQGYPTVVIILSTLSSPVSVTNSRVVQLLMIAFG